MEEKDGTEVPQETEKAQRETPGRGGRRRALLGCGIAAAALAVGLGVTWATGALGTAARLPAEGGEPVEVEPAREDADLGEAMSGLTYSGRDVSVDRDAVTVTARSGHVMVEERSDADAATRVDLSARRCAALAHALDGEGVGGEKVSDVTWVACDPGGSVKFAVVNDVASDAASRAGGASGDAAPSADGGAPTDATGDASEGAGAEAATDGGVPAEGAAASGAAGNEDGGPTPGAADDSGTGSGDAPSEPTTSEVVSGSTGWTMSDDTKDGLSDAAPDLPQQGGQAPTTPDGEQVTPGETAPEQPSDEQPAEGAAGDGGGSSDGAGGAQQPASSGGSTAPSGGSAGTGGSVPSGSQASSDSSSPAPSAPAHEHSWQAVTATRWVQDSAAWDETVVVSAAWDEAVYTTVTRYTCGYCGATFDSHDAFDIHNDAQHDSEANYRNKDVKIQTGTVHHDAVTKTVHHDATGHNETYVTGYRCSGCGATK